MTIDSPSLATVIREAIETKLVDVHTGMPGRVESYDEEAQTANIRPLIKRVLREVDGSRVPEELPVLPSVPVAFPGSGGFSMTWPLAPGDTGMLLFSEMSIDRWRTTNEVIDPGDGRRHGLSGAMFVPGLRAQSGKLPGAAVSATAMVMRPNVILGDSTASEPIVLGSALNTWLSTHTHSSAMGPTGPPLEQIALPDHLSTKHKADS